MLLASLVCTGVHGALQERTYSTYGPYWRESIFYTVRPHYHSNI
jgi:UDP-xylose/UDP-N-acetylglucosamine transporter B4